MEFLTLTKENIDSEHICCAISDKKSVQGYADKKQWIKQRIDQGYVFLKLPVRGKVFIEYCPVEVSLLPVEAPNFMVINCFWVSGKYKKSGYGQALLQQCIDDSKLKGRDGLVVLCSDRKRPFLSDKKFFIKQGFTVCDTADPYFELLTLSFSKKIKPRFSDSVSRVQKVNSEGFIAFYSKQCVYTNYYTDLQAQIASKYNLSYQKVLIENREQALNSPSPFTAYALYFRGKFITHELTAEKKFITIIERLLQQ